MISHASEARYIGGNYMKKVAHLIIACGFLTMGTPALADFQTGNTLLEKCTTDKNQATYYQDNAFCVGYSVAAFDMFDTWQLVTNTKRCVNDGMTQGQIKDVLVSYLRTHPGERHEAASVIALVAFKDAFGCVVPGAR